MSFIIAPMILARVCFREAHNILVPPQSTEVSQQHNHHPTLFPVEGQCVNAQSMYALQ
jgi:hypothetical protein